MTISRWIKEPLFHFLLIGAGLFALYYFTADPDAGRPNRITVAQTDIDRLAAQWQQRRRRPPTALELQGLVDTYIREEILYREALALGLDKNDIIIRRRLGQKLEFMFKDLGEQVLITDEEIREYYERNAERYREPALYTFSQVYLSWDQRGDNVETDAKMLLEQLRKQTAPVDVAAVSDRFLLDYEFEGQAEHQLTRMFGQKFAEQISKLELGSWQGPIASGYGLHLIYIKERSEPRAPDLAEVKDKVRWDLQNERSKTMDKAFYEELRRRYEIKIEGSVGARQEVAQKEKQ